MPPAHSKAARNRASRTEPAKQGQSNRRRSPRRLFLLSWATLRTTDLRALATRTPPTHTPPTCTPPTHTIQRAARFNELGNPSDSRPFGPPCSTPARTRGKISSLSGQIWMKCTTMVVHFIHIWPADFPIPRGLRLLLAFPQVREVRNQGLL